MRKPLTQSETDELNSVLERAVQRMERHKRNGDATDNELKTLTGVLAALRDEPRDE